MLLSGKRYIILHGNLLSQSVSQSVWVSHLHSDISLENTVCVCVLLTPSASCSWSVIIILYSILLLEKGVLCVLIELLLIHS